MLMVFRGIEQTTILARKLADLGIDLIDVSSGGNDLRGKIKLGPSYRECRRSEGQDGTVLRHLSPLTF
jgi:hypothetical protein